MNTAPEWCPVSHFGFNPSVPDNQTLDQCDHAPWAMAKLQTTVRDWACTRPRQPTSCRSWTNPSLQTVVRDLASFLELEKGLTPREYAVGRRLGSKTRGY